MTEEFVCGYLLYQLRKFRRIDHAACNEGLGVGNVCRVAAYDLRKDLGVGIEVHEGHFAVGVYEYVSLRFAIETGHKVGWLGEFDVDSELFFEHGDVFEHRIERAGNIDVDRPFAKIKGHGGTSASYVEHRFYNIIFIVASAAQLAGRIVFQLRMVFLP